MQVTQYQLNLSIPLNSTSGSAQGDAGGGGKPALGFLLGAPDAVIHSRAVCIEGLQREGLGEPLGVPHSPPACPVPALAAQPPWKTLSRMGMLLKGNNTNTWEVSSTVRLPEPQPETSGECP